MSDDKANAFDRAFEQTDIDCYDLAREHVALQTIAYLTALMARAEEIASFTVAEIIEHLNRRL